MVVLVRGPEQPVRITRRHKVAGLWLNSPPVVFRGAPGFYRAASNRPLADIANFGTLRRLGAGMDHLPISAPAEQRTETRYGVRDVVVSRLGADYYVWRRAVVRLKQNAGLYDEDERGVRFVDRGLFRAEISLPAGAPTGFIARTFSSLRMAARSRFDPALSRSRKSDLNELFTCGRM